MRVLVACEYSGIVREAFRAKGHDAYSCDIIPTEKSGPHIISDAIDVIGWGWDLMIAHPPCTFLSYAGNRWLKQPGRYEKQVLAGWFCKAIFEADIPKICLENPRGYIVDYIGQPNQYIQPYQHGHPMTKATGLWLKGLPNLEPTDVLTEYFSNWTKYKGSHNGKARSKTFTGIAEAMASQWG